MKVAGVLVGIGRKDRNGRPPVVWADIEGLRVYITDPELLERTAALVHQEVVASVRVRYYNTPNGFFSKLTLQAIWPADNHH